MGKTLKDSIIHYGGIYSVIEKHVGWLNQAVKTTSDVIFHDGTFTGSIDVGEINITENIMLLNSGEEGAGVSEGIAGLEIDRGSLPNYFILFDEEESAVKIGTESNFKFLLGREDDPLDKGVLVWDQDNNTSNFQNTIDIDFNFSSTTDSTEQNTGAVKIRGGAYVEKNLLVFGKLGIGVENPVHNLDIIGSGNIVSDTDANLMSIKSEHLSFSSSILTLETDMAPDSDFNFINMVSDGSTLVQIRGDGHVGIGTSSSSYMLDVDGDVNFSGNINLVLDSPTITFSSTTNITGSITQRNSRILDLGSEVQLWLVLELNPTDGNSLVSFRFSLPEKINNITNVYDVISNSSGFIANLTSVQNMITTGVVGGTNATTQFQPISTAAHYVQIIICYSK